MLSSAVRSAGAALHLVTCNLRACGRAAPGLDVHFDEAPVTNRMEGSGQLMHSWPPVLT